ncbi:uncharacterized protein K444DRAFT_654349 [Hyaloscypha bicolor E]|uniref:Uncharacterized protein n=1 Tax=Hyaloscypha bicolor E TaxID=1095630 RepID=A0A2J6T2W8_9HELO|nr:uncharacterized protein K444DRAFT_654349 [Hyaloscypha bicolor E]PMD57381.1 hypothetical protein K444DRAFT_654349 [Hyaloscypha bicolor E]
MHSHFSLRHIPTLFASAATTFGGVIHFFNAEYAISQAVMVIGMARITAIGIAIFTVYPRGKLEVVNTVMAILRYVGFVNGFRAGSGLAIAAWGWFSMTAGR